MRVLKLWTKCPRCRHLCRHKLTPDGDGLVLVGPDCDYCENERHVVVQLGTLAQNLAVAGGLCQAWWMGAYWMCDASMWYPGVGYAHDDYEADLALKRACGKAPPASAFPKIIMIDGSDESDGPLPET